MARDIWIDFFGIFLLITLGVVPLWMLYKAGELTWNWEAIKEFFSLNKPRPKPKHPPENP